MYFLYVLRSKKDGTYYIGSTGNIENRLERYNSGRSKYTKSRRPFEIVYKEIYNILSEAKKREYYLKSLKSKITIEKLIKDASLPIR